jgi:hypothetical protein
MGEMFGKNDAGQKILVLRKGDVNVGGNKRE